MLLPTQPVTSEPESTARAQSSNLDSSAKKNDLAPVNLLSFALSGESRRVFLPFRFADVYTASPVFWGARSHYPWWNGNGRVRSGRLSRVGDKHQGHR